MPECSSSLSIIGHDGIQCGRHCGGKEAPSNFNIALMPGIGGGGLGIYIGRVSGNRDFLREFCQEQ